MRVARLFLLTCLVICGALAYSQSPDLSTKISLNLKNADLKEFLNEITNQTKIPFSYSNSLTGETDEIKCRYKSKTVSYVLKDVLGKNNIEYKVVENVIVLRTIRKYDDEEKISRNKSDRYTVSGFVTQEGNGESMPFASVIVKESTLGTVTNAYGFFSLTLEEGFYTLQVSYLGYDVRTVEINLNRNVSLFFNLSPRYEMIEEAKVVAKDSNKQNVSGQAQMILPYTEKILMAGESELLKSLQYSPGIKGFGDASVYFSGRGAGKSHNQIIIDESPVYNPSHLIGLFSSLLPETARDISVYNGYSPAQYGGNLASVIHITTKEGNLQKWSAGGNISPFTIFLFTEGPLKVDKSSFYLALRRFRFNRNMKKYPRLPDLKYYDVYFKTNIRLGLYDRMFFSFYYSGDIYADDNKGTSLEWSNFASSVRWNHLYNEKLFANTVVSASKYNYLLYTSVENNNYWNNYIGSASLKHSLAWYPAKNHKAEAGLQLTGFTINPGNYHTTQPNSELIIPVIPLKRVTLIENYYSYSFCPIPKLYTEAGVRLGWFMSRGPTEELIYNEKHIAEDTASYDTPGVYNTFFLPEPRLLIEYRIDSTYKLFFNYRHSYQSLHLISNTTTPFTGLETWLPSGPSLKPEHNDYFGAGLLSYYKGIGLTAGLETYYRRINNYIEYKDHALLLLNNAIEGEFRTGSLDAYGAELFLRKNSEKTSYSVAYTYSRSLVTVPEISNGQTYPSLYDKPHQVSATLQYRAGKRTEYSLAWIYSTGQPTTAPTGFYEYLGIMVPIYDSRNNSRLRDYHRLDISVNFRLNRNRQNRFRHDLTLSIYNVYNRKNPFTVNYNKIVNENGHYVVVSDTNDPDYLTTEKYIFGFLPSFSYKFSF